MFPQSTDITPDPSNFAFIIIAKSDISYAWGLHKVFVNSI